MYGIFSPLVGVFSFTVLHLQH